MRKLDPFHQRESCTLLLPQYKRRHSLSGGETYVQQSSVIRLTWRTSFVVALILAISAAIISFLGSPETAVGVALLAIQPRHWVVSLKFKYG
jgi:hypothetical protein